LSNTKVNDNHVTIDANLESCSLIVYKPETHVFLLVSLYSSSLTPDPFT